MRGALPAVAVAVAAVLLPASGAGAPPAAAPSAERGRAVYRDHCLTCHGRSGRGDGPSARWLQPPPRDLERAEYRFRTTPSGELPTDADLLRTLDVGLPGTSMPPWRDRLPLQDRLDVIAYVKALSDRFDEEDREPPIAIPEPEPVGPDTLERGRKAYLAMKCESCHGEGGQGDGPANATLKDSAGRPTVAFDFTRGTYKNGGTAKDLYRTFMTGLDGTPMPSYMDSVPEADRWPLVHYTLSLERPRGLLYTLFAPLQEQSP